MARASVVCWRATCCADVGRVTVRVNAADGAVDVRFGVASSVAVGRNNGGFCLRDVLAFGGMFGLLFVLWFLTVVAAVAGWMRMLFLVMDVALACVFLITNFPQGSR
jgi:hypothetical protein